MKIKISSKKIYYIDFFLSGEEMYLFPFGAYDCHPLQGLHVSGHFFFHI